ncbi:hypothetical protein [Pseudomonas aeruginosa]|uniref:hypothetical protein n=1 Tax=Pseudomonas aeruginosa TaxID=287 RepID=UPI001EE2DF53|nr:hypothetical protein [Pseudomonas aeruginosa]
MNRLAHWLAATVHEKVRGSTQGFGGTNLEYRLIFRGPPLELLEPAYDELARDGGIQVPAGADGGLVILPVLLQYPAGQLQGSRPRIGASGKCDNDHLLDVRNDPANPSFIALVPPPGLHNNLSIESTTDEFGLGATTSTGHASFEQWWEDGFVQQAVNEALLAAGITDAQRDDARGLVRAAAASVDEVDPDKGGHRAAWRLLSRIYSIANANQGLPAGTALSLACGLPPMNEGGVSAKTQLSVLGKIADELADGFKTGIERLAQGVPQEVAQALRELLSHLQSNCDVPTAFERATAAFYLPSADIELAPPPFWWTSLTTEQWTELLADEPDEAVGELTIRCTNSVIPMGKGLPAVVRDKVELVISTSEESQPNEFLLAGGSYGKVPVALPADSNGTTSHIDLCPSPHRAPMSYKVSADGCKPASVRVISLAYWKPGLLVTCRLATKLSPPRKPRKSSAAIDWETSLSLPGSGRYELRLHLAPGASIGKVEGLPDDATEFEEQRETIEPRQVGEDEYLVEIEADGKYQLDIAFTPAGEQVPKACRVYLTCEEAKEEGCRSEFERLIKLNRRHLEKFDTKAVVHLDRNARSSSLQSWMLEDQNVSNSFRPLVIADDYASRWPPLTGTPRMALYSPTGVSCMTPAPGP